MKHVIVRGRPVGLNPEGRPAGIEVARGSLVVSFRDGPALTSFCARLAGEAWEGLGSDPITAILALSKDILSHGVSDYPASLPTLMCAMQEEI